MSRVSDLVLGRGGGGYVVTLRIVESCACLTVCVLCCWVGKVRSARLGRRRLKGRRPKDFQPINRGFGSLFGTGF